VAVYEDWLSDERLGAVADLEAEEQQLGIE